MNELYKILKVKPSATKGEIQKSFRRLAKETHPDLNKSNPNKIKLFEQIKEAYDILSNDEKREKYNREQELKQHTQSTSNPTSSTEEWGKLQKKFYKLLKKKRKLLNRIKGCFFVICISAILLYLTYDMRFELRYNTVILIFRILIGVAFFCLIGLFISGIRLLKTKRAIKKMVKSNTR